jgi:chorismate synthase
MNQDSVGGEIECFAIGLPVGVGGNMFDTVESKLASVLFGVPAVKGIQFGMGFDFAKANASKVNDEYEIKDGKVALCTNNNGGVLGGMTTGAPIVVSVAIKPTPSISKEQRSVNLQTMQNETLVIHGRHDPCIVPRAVPVIEAAVALGILDLMM